jgi:transposase-like protein
MNFPYNHLGTLVKHCHFDSSIIIVCIRWCITSKLSYRDLVAIMTERNVDVVHPTILRWVQRYVPEFEKCWQRYARPVDASWRVDATYLKVKGQWDYLSRAVDSAGQTVDFLLSTQRDSAAAKHFFEHTIEGDVLNMVITHLHWHPELIAIDE